MDKTTLLDYMKATLTDSKKHTVLLQIKERTKSNDFFFYINRVEYQFNL
jgi:hypothetical protein